MANKEPFQFGIKFLLWLTLTSALIVALLSLITRHFGWEVTVILLCIFGPEVIGGLYVLMMYLAGKSHE